MDRVGTLLPVGIDRNRVDQVEIVALGRRRALMFRSPDGGYAGVRLDTITRARHGDVARVRLADLTPGERRQAPGGESWSHRPRVAAAANVESRNSATDASGSDAAAAAS